MSDILCSYKDREAVLMAYLYDEITPSDREVFDAHLTTCARCRVELNGLGGVRAQLARWAPPEMSGGGQALTVASRPASVVGQPSSVVGQPSSVASQAASVAGHRGWNDIPGWAQAAAAILILGVSAGVANLNVHYDAQNGLNIRTGWSSNVVEHAAAPATASERADVATRTELTALEQQLRSEIQAVSSASSGVRTVSAPNDSLTSARRFKSLLEENERRHERELALRIAEVVRDVNAQRQADLVKIDQNLGLIDRRNDIEVRRNRQMIDMYLKTVSQRQ